MALAFCPQTMSDNLVKNEEKIKFDEINESIKRNVFLLATVAVQFFQLTKIRELTYSGDPSRKIFSFFISLKIIFMFLYR